MLLFQLERHIQLILQVINYLLLFLVDQVKHFLAFDEERYSLIRSDGQTEALDADRFNFY